MSPRILEILSRTECRRCGSVMQWNLAGVPTCTACRKREHPEIDALVAPEIEQAHRAHAILVEVAERRQKRAS